MIKIPLKNKIKDIIFSNNFFKRYITPEYIERVAVYVFIFIALSFLLRLAGLYITLTGQAIIGYGLVVILLLFKRIEKFKKPPLRILFILLASFITMRYWFWRTYETLIWTGPLDFIAMIALYFAELYAITIHSLGIFSNIWPLETKPASLPEDTSLYPSVDVLIPTYSEPEDIMKITATASLNIDYPKDKLNVYILDDGATVAKRNDPKTSSAAWERYYTLRRIAREIGVNYITREKNLKAKAGNLNHGIRHTKSDLILVLDCDHVPTKDILKNTVGWFLKDEKLAFVQTPHFFINPTPIEKNLAIFQDAPSENEMFYRSNHLGLNLWNSSFFCGSAAVLRRKYLEEVGGISGETITEDCETAFLLHKKGYSSVYISRPLICGLSPETFDDFIRQRSRWAQGMTQILVLNNPLLTKGLKLYQRLCYFNNCFFWFFGITRFLFFIAPALFILFGLKIYFASVEQVLVYALPHLVGSVILMDFLYGKFRWPFFSELFESIQSLFLMPVALSTLANPRKSSFKVTPKGKNLENEFLSGLSFPFFIMSVILLIAMPVAVIKWFEYPLYRDVILVTIVWCTFNFSLAMASFGAFFERRQVRRHYRLWAKGKALIFFPRLKKTLEADIQDISMSGIGISFKLDIPLMPLEHIIFETRNSYGERYKMEARMQRIVKKDNIYTCGCEFNLLTAEQYSTAVHFAYGDSQRWVDFWERKTKTASILWVLYFILRMMIKGVEASVIALLQFILLPIKNYIRFIMWKFDRRIAKT
ncbi:MAG TPA: UDP-forming cellulose synthase catalytic subunit [Thermodesulfovibrionia bacterium]|nr:UDP-forming cellulose synthase catalytic subunit [Thermodesulfovibrionia bacterium]